MKKIDSIAQCPKCLLHTAEGTSFCTRGKILPDLAVLRRAHIQRNRCFITDTMIKVNVMKERELVAFGISRWECLIESKEQHTLTARLTEVFLMFVLVVVAQMNRGALL